MRAQVLGLSAVSLLFLAGGDCCGVGEPALMVGDDVSGRCYSGDCPLAIGADVVVMAYPDPDIRGASLEDPSLATLELMNGNLIVHPLAPGTVKLRTALADNSVLTARLVFAARATTRVTPLVHIDYENDAPGRPQVFTGTTFDVFADHRDAADQTLLGTGLEDWSITGGSFSGSPEGVRLVRRVVAGSEPRLVVSARPDSAPLEVDVLPAGSTAHLDLQTRIRQRDTGVITATFGVVERIWVSPYAANDRFIYGVPAGGDLTVTTDDPEIATAHLGSGREIQVTAKASGSTTMTVVFDGITRSFRIDVE